MAQIPVSCSKDCSGGCPLLAHVEDGVLKRISDNPAGSRYMHGCINGYQMPRTLYHPERIVQPLVRSGERGSGQFRTVSWEEAIAYVGERLVEARLRHGAQSILNMAGTGSVSGALHNTFALPKRFFSLFGGYTDLTSSYSSAACKYATPYVLGDAHQGIDPATLQASRMIILWGANLLDTRLGCEMPANLMKASRRGIPIIVIDPRRTSTIRQTGAQWMPCLPGTDAALMLAVLHELLQENLVDWSFVEKYSTGFDQLAGYVVGEDGTRHDPAWAELICGTPAVQITEFARQYGKTRPAALIPGLSIQRTPGGEETHRLAIALQVATGNLGCLGGSSGGSNNRLPKPRVGRLPIPAHPPQPGIPILHWPDAILEGKQGGYPSQIKVIYNTGSNYLAQGCDVKKNIRAFMQVDFAVCHDYFLTPTARYCDVILPATTYLERNDIVTPDAGNYLLFSRQAVLPVGEARTDYEIFCALAERMGFGAAFSDSEDEEGWLRSFVTGSDVLDYDEFRQSGIYLAGDQMRVGLADFVSNPQAYPLNTPSGKVEITSESYQRDTGFPAIPSYRPQPASAEYPLRLVTPKSRFRIHSQGSNIHWLRQREEQALWLHSDDATKRQIRDGELVEIYNSQGRVRICARVNDDIIPGAVCLLEGIWPQFDEQGIETAGSANVLSSTEGTLPSQGSATHGIQVQVVKA